MGMDYRKWVLPGVVIVFLLLLPLWAYQYILSMFIMAGVYGMAALGVALLTGYAGQVNLGANVFMLLGAYTSAILAVDYGISPWFGTLCAAILTGVIAYIIGRAILWLHGFILAVATASIALIIYRLTCELQITGGFLGISRIPHYAIGGFALDQEAHYYYLVLVVLAVLYVVTSNLIKSRFGRGLKALNLYHGGSEVASETLGLDVGKLKTLVFVVSAVYASIGGSIYAHYTTCITPEPFNLWWGLMLIVMATVGGMRIIYGPLIGAGVFFGLKEIIGFSRAGAAETAGLGVFVFGLIFVLCLVFMPQGIAQIPSMVHQRWGRRDKGVIK
jgi:branched-chain amino acid transport system permease protein